MALLTAGHETGYAALCWTLALLAQLVRVVLVEDAFHLPPSTSPRSSLPSAPSRTSTPCGARASARARFGELDVRWTVDGTPPADEAVIKTQKPGPGEILTGGVTLLAF